MRFGNEPRGVHHGEDRLVRGGEVALIERTIGHHAIDGTRNSRITELRFGALHFAFRGRARTLGGLECLLFSHALQVRKLLLGLLVLAAGLQKGNFGGVQVFPGNSALLEQFLAALVDFLLGIESRLRRGGLQFGLLNLLRQTGANGRNVVSFRLFEVTLARLRRRGQILVFEFGKQLSFFYPSASLHIKFPDGRGYLRGDRSLLKRIDDRFGGNDLGNGRALRRRGLHRDDGIFFLFGLAAAACKERCETNHQHGKGRTIAPEGSKTVRQFHGVVSTPVRVCKFASATR